MPRPDPPTYQHTQRAPWFLLLFASAALFFTIAWFEWKDPVLRIVFPLTGVMMAALGYSFQHLTVTGEGDELVIAFGPLRLFTKRIPYDRIVEVQPGRTTFLDGWGIHMSLRGGWVWNIWGRDCVVIKQQRGVTRVGTDDPQGLLAFLQQRTDQGSTADGGRLHG